MTKKVPKKKLDWIDDLELPDLKFLNYNPNNPAHLDFILDLIELIATKLCMKKGKPTSIFKLVLMIKKMILFKNFSSEILWLLFFR